MKFNDNAQHLTPDEGDKHFQCVKKKKRGERAV